MMANPTIEITVRFRKWAFFVLVVMKFIISLIVLLPKTWTEIVEWDKECEKWARWLVDNGAVEVGVG